MKILIGLMVILWPILAFSQPLKPGDDLPAIQINHLLRYPTPSVSTTSLKGKVIIIDFFATWCGACLNELKHFDTLQKQFNGQLQILVVTTESRSRINTFLTTNKTAASVVLPFVTDDTVLTKLFPHSMIPHEVWIDKKGKVACITVAHYVNAQNIAALINDKKLVLPVKKDMMDFDRNVPLLENGNGDDGQSLMYKSLMAKHFEGAPTMAGHTMNADSNTRRVYYINQSILSLYSAALRYSFDNRIVFEVNDISRYIDDKEPWDTWAAKNQYSYELTVPASVPNEQVRNYMLQDVNRCLGLNGRMEKRLVKCYALVQLTKDTGMLASKGDEPASEWYNKDHPFISVHNKPLSYFVSNLNSQILASPLKPIVLDETNYHLNVDLELHANPDDLRALKEELKKYNLSLIETQRELNVFVLTEKDYVAPLPSL